MIARDVSECNSWCIGCIAGTMIPSMPTIATTAMPPAISSAVLRASARSAPLSRSMTRGASRQRFAAASTSIAATTTSLAESSLPYSVAKSAATLRTR